MYLGQVEKGVHFSHRGSRFIRVKPEGKLSASRLIGDMDRGGWLAVVNLDTGSLSVLPQDAIVSLAPLHANTRPTPKVSCHEQVMYWQDATFQDSVRRTELQMALDEGKTILAWSFGKWVEFQKNWSFILPAHKYVIVEECQAAIILVNPMTLCKFVLQAPDLVPCSYVKTKGQKGYLYLLPGCTLEPEEVAICYAAFVAVQQRAAWIEEARAGLTNMSFSEWSKQ